MDEIDHSNLCSCSHDANASQLESFDAHAHPAKPVLDLHPDLTLEMIHFDLKVSERMSSRPLFVDQRGDAVPAQALGDVRAPVGAVTEGNGILPGCLVVGFRA